MSACENGNLEIVRVLLGRGADVNALRIDDGSTSLMYACRRGHLEVASMLLAHKASKITVDFHGNTAYTLTAAANAELRALVKP